MSVSCPFETQRADLEDPRASCSLVVRELRDYQVTITPFVTFAAVGEQKLGTPPRYHSA